MNFFHIKFRPRNEMKRNEKKKDGKIEDLQPAVVVGIAIVEVGSDKIPLELKCCWGKKGYCCTI